MQWELYKGPKYLIVYMDFKLSQLEPVHVGPIVGHLYVGSLAGSLGWVVTPPSP